MRASIIALTVAVPFGLAACNAEPEQAEVGEDVQEEIEGPVEEEVQQELGVETDAYNFTTYDTDADGYLSEDEYNTGIGDANFGTYDTDADARLSETEFGAYQGGTDM